MTARAVLWDFGGVILESPFDAFARYERENGLPADFLRGLNARDHHTNAWAKLERNDVSRDDFCLLFEAEAAAAGHPIDARGVLSLLSGAIRPEMVTAVQRCAESIWRHGHGCGPHAIGDPLDRLARAGPRGRGASLCP